MMANGNSGCELCAQEGGEVLWRNGKLRVVLVEDANYPGFCRIIWQAHVQEMTDLAPADREELMRVVWQVESTLRTVMRADKINVASLGNVVPHLHWHVIPRFCDDAHFPSPIWAAALREAAADQLQQRRARLPVLREALLRALDSVSSSHPLK